MGPMLAPWTLQSGKWLPMGDYKDLTPQALWFNFGYTFLVCTGSKFLVVTAIRQNAASLAILASLWRHQTETFSALLAICAGNSPAIGEFPAQRPVTRSFDVCFDLRLNKWLSKQSWGWWFETPSLPLWRHCNVLLLVVYYINKQFILSVYNTLLSMDTCAVQFLRLYAGWSCRILATT